MGHFSSTTNSIVQTAENVISGTWGTPAYFNHWIYNQSEGDVLRAFSITNGVMSSSPVSQSTVSIGGTGYAPTISANGTSNAIVWVIDAGAYEQGANNNSSDTSSGPSILRAFNATNLSQQLYNSSLKASDVAPGAVKYPVATVADGKVFVGGDFGVAVYGIGVILPPPIISPNGGVYTNSVTVSMTDATNGVSIYYTLNGTAPTTNSLLYTGPFVLTNTVEVNAIAAQPGAFNSVASSASFINSSSIGSGTGLLGSYWSNTPGASFTNLTFTNPPSLVRTDAMINFNFGNNGPAPSVGKSNYAARWTGCVQPQFSEPYTFYTTSDDGVLLYINGELVINDWANQAATAQSNTINLTAQQLYNIELEYYYSNDNGGQVSLAWSSPSIPQALIPQTQLYPYTNPPPSIVFASPANGSVYTATASVSLGVTADAPYNSISEVAFYANGNLLGILNESLDAPLYAMTMTGFQPNPGGQTANSSQVSATPSASVSNNLTTMAVEAAGTDWTAAIWQTNGTGLAVAPVAGDICTCLTDGTTYGNNTANTRIRNPAAAGVHTFPGNSLTLNANCELRAKGGTIGESNVILNFPGVNGQPGLILNGGILNGGDDGTYAITGNIQVASPSFICNGTNGGGGGIALNRAFNITGALSGPGSITILNAGTNVPQQISGANNTNFTGQWIVQCGWLRGFTTNSLGTNSITVNPADTSYLVKMPNVVSPRGPALFEADYPLNSLGALTLTNGGQMNLLQNCTFAAVAIEGTTLDPGTYSYAELSARFPSNFLPGGSGSLTVSPFSPPGPVTPPGGLSALAGNASVSLSWNPSPGATNYVLQRSSANGGPYTLVASLAGTNFTDTNVLNGTTYYYVIAAVSAPGYTLTAVAADGSGLSSTSAPVQIIVNAGSGLPYGLTNRATVQPFLNMPTSIPSALPGSIPLLLSQTGVYSNTPNRIPAGGLIPYVPNTPLWSDGAQKSRYMAVPNSGGVLNPSEQIAFVPTNSWTFPAGTIFVKNFDLAVNTTNPNIPLQRLETRLLVRNINGGVYGVTYKWRPDNSDADLLITSSNQTILVTNAAGVTNQTWYYPSPVDCLTCHTAVANYVLGVNTRQLNGTMTYPATGNTDNQLRTLNRLGLFYPAIDEAGIANFAQLSALTNAGASLVQRFRSYMDANCAQCHQPGGAGITFDARYDTPLPQQNITNYPAQLSLGIDNACIIKADDVWRSMILVRINSLNPASQMPPLARNAIDTNAVQVITAWINSLPGTPALAPPVILPNGGAFIPSVSVTLQPPDTNATLYYTLNGKLPTTNSFLYTGPFLLTNSATIEANAFESNFNSSVAAGALFTVLPGISFTSAGFNANGAFQLGFSGVAGSNYVLQATTDFVNWASLVTNQASNNAFDLLDANATNYPYRFYRVMEP
jgi:mono/diheme cytochrome c family protein